MLGIITAITKELDSVLEKVIVLEEREHAGIKFYKVSYKNKEFVLTQSGVGKVNAACCAQALIDLYNVKGIINVGVGGALRSNYNIGDVIISRDSIQYDMDASAFGYSRGEIPNLDITYFPANPLLIESAERAAGELKISYDLGRIATADIGVSEKQLKDLIVIAFEGNICDMEGAAIAQACYLNGVPYLVIRSVSDFADDEAASSFSTNARKSSDRGTQVILRMIENGITL